MCTFPCVNADVTFLALWEKKTARIFYGSSFQGSFSYPASFSSTLLGSSSTYFFSSKIRLMMGPRSLWRYCIPATFQHRMLQHLLKTNCFQCIHLQHPKPHMMLLPWERTPWTWKLKSCFWIRCWVRLRNIRNSGWVPNTVLIGFILRYVLLNKISYILTILFQLQFEKHIQELFDESLTQEKLHQVSGYFLSVLRCRGLID